MTATTTERPVTVEQVNELPAEADHCVVLIAPFVINLIGKPIIIKKVRECGKRARAYVLVSCPNHGSARLPVCAKHLRSLQDGHLHIGCNRCDTPAVWTESPF